MKYKMTVNDTVREALAIALLQLMKGKDISEITISEIVKVAGVGRSSFYRNFESREHLLCSYIVDLYHEFFNTNDIPKYALNESMREAFLLPRFKFIREHKDIFTTLYRRNMLYYFFERIEDDLLLTLCGQTADMNSYYRAMCSGSCAAIVRLWIERGFRESDEEMAALFINPPKLSC